MHIANVVVVRVNAGPNDQNSPSGNELAAEITKALCILALDCDSRTLGLLNLAAAEVGLKVTGGDGVVVRKGPGTRCGTRCRGAPYNSSKLS